MPADTIMGGGRIRTIGPQAMVDAIAATAKSKRRFADRDDVPLRVIGYLRHNKIADMGLSPGDGDEKFTIQGVKLWYDGSPYTGTMLVDEPYLQSDLCCGTLGIAPGSTGYATFEPSKLVEILSGLAADGWQVLTHAQGDRGCREILHFYERSLGTRSATDHRWRLERCLPLADHDLVRAKSVGVSPSFHADSPMYPPGPLHLERTPATRLTRLGDRLGADQTISVELELRAGSIEPGKRADFAVLDGDPFEMAPSDIDRIAISGTWLDGRPVSGTLA